MDEDQIDRYEAFRRSSLQKASMRKVIACALPLHAPPTPSLHVLREIACPVLGHAYSVRGHLASLTPHPLRTHSTWSICT